VLYVIAWLLSFNYKLYNVWGGKMGSTFSGLEIGKRALWAQKQALEVTGHNISNANTEGYSRQEAIQTATAPRSASFGAGQMGTGVEVSEVRRVRDEFVDGQIRKESRTKGYWDVKEDSLNEIELIFNEPSDQGVQQTMSDFWNSMQDLNNKPGSKAVRATVRQRALAVTDTFNHIDTQLNDYRSSINSQIGTTVQEVNSYSNRIADLNKQIVRVESDGQDANDLRDKRTKLVNGLAKLINIQVKEDDVGALRVSSSGNALVQGENMTELAATPNPSNDNMFEVEWANGNDINLRDGKLKGLKEIRDKDIDKYRSQLDDLANNLITEFNAQHRSGYGLNTVNHAETAKQADATSNLNLQGQFDIKVDGTNQGTVTVAAGDSLNDLQTKVDAVSGVNASVNGDNQLEIDGTGSKISLENTSASGNDNILEELAIGVGQDFFTGTDANTMDLASKMKTDAGIQDIAAATKMADSNGDGVNDYAGDGSNALQMAELETTDIMNSGSATFSDYYGSNIAQLGVESQRAQRMVGNQDTLLTSLEQQQESASGVSLDEEMNNMVKYQHAYNAAAKVVSTMDELLGTVVNGLKR
jgi:flagellar hook-associated protein 1 FlgK